MQVRLCRFTVLLFTLGFSVVVPRMVFAGTPVAVTTYKYDNQRSGANVHETILTPANVNAQQFGRLFTYNLLSKVYAQPLYVPNVNIKGTLHNIVIVAGEEDDLSAFDADHKQYLWRRVFTRLYDSITPMEYSDAGGNEISRHGISGTPVVDVSTQTLYAVVATDEPFYVAGGYVHRLHAIDLSTGEDRPGSPVIIAAKVPGTGVGKDGSGNVVFEPKQHLQRPALLLANGLVYVAFGSRSWSSPFHGWLMAYRTADLSQAFAFTTTPNGSGGGIWQRGGGLAADAAGNIYLQTGYGTYSGNTGGRDYSNTFLKLSPMGALLDFFTPHDYAGMKYAGTDLSSCAPLLLPLQSGAHSHVLTGAGQNRKIYVLDRDNMGHYEPSSDSQIVQSLPQALAHGCQGEPAYWNGWVYYGAENDNLHQFKLSAGRLLSPALNSTVFFAGTGFAPNPTISANGTSNGIVWTVRQDANGHAVLHALDATNIAHELYNSNQAGGRDAFVNSTLRQTPVFVVNGKAYVQVDGYLAVFGLLK